MITKVLYNCLPKLVSHKNSSKDFIAVLIHTQQKTNGFWKRQKIFKMKKHRKDVRLANKMPWRIVP